MRKITLICASVLLSAGALHAEAIASAQARQAAAAYVGQHYAPAGVARRARRLAAPAVLSVSACQTLGNEAAPLGFAVELSPSGFVLIRADNHLPPVKLHSANGSYKALPAGFRAVIEAELAGELADLRDLRRAHHAPEARHHAAWQALAQTASPDVDTLTMTSVLGTESASSSGTILVTTAWDQGAPYNFHAPPSSGGSGGHASAGCGPIALAQIVRYHKKPAAPASDFSYTDSSGACTGTHAVSDAGGLGDYDWANMPDTVTTSSPDAQKQAVGRLIYHCGVAMEADYEATATSVISQFVAARAFRDVFGYTCEDFQSKADYSTPVWLAKIQTDIDAHRPVYYTMVSALGGHAVVCDGYRNASEIHLNFGVAGYGDAWYNIDSVVFYGYVWSRHEGVFQIAPDTAAVSNRLTVVSGAGGGYYLAGTTVELAADARPEGYRFRQWSVAPAEADLGDSFDPTQAVTTLRMPNHNTTLTAEFTPPNQAPVLTRCSPSYGSLTVREGASSAFSVTANDSTDPNAGERGMASITWLVDGVPSQVTTLGAPNAIASSFVYAPGTGTVNGAASKDVTVRMIAQDKQSGCTETNWTVRVYNAPAGQAIRFPALSAKVLGDPDFAPGATASSGLAVAYESSNPAVAVIAGGAVRIVGAGAAVLTASQPGSFDFLAAALVRQTLSVRARLTADVPDGGGTVFGAGLYTPGAKVSLTARPLAGFTFLRWEDNSQAAARSHKMPNANVAVQAFFAPTANVAPPAISDPGAQRLTVGVFCSLPLAVASESLPTVTVSGLPAGLTFSPAARVIRGVPTSAVTNKAVTITAKNVNRSAAVRQFNVTVDALPAWAQGAFKGTCLMRDFAEPGSAEMTVTAQGKITGKLSASGTNYTFSAGSYTNAFMFSVLARAGQAKVPLTVAVAHAEPGSGAPAALGVAEGRLHGASDGEAPVVMYRTVWRDAGMSAAATNYTGYYTAVLPCGEAAGCGYLCLTVDKVGGIKTVGKLADGTAVALSGTLLVDEAGSVFAVLYSAPAAYRGGCFLALAEFVKPEAGPVFVRLKSGASALWESRNARATGEYGAGFARELGLQGGWYDTLGNLARYYADGRLWVGADSARAPALTLGTNRYESSWWRPDGLALSVRTNATGVLTGLSAPLAGAPVKAGGAYDYAGTNNAVALTLALTRPTGLYRGSFRAWFDYGATHTYALLPFEGVLVPERENKDDGLQGGGFFLWADQASTLNALGQKVPYGFKWSCSFLLFSAPPEE